MKNDLISRSTLWTDIQMLPHNGDMISSEEVEQAVKDAPAVNLVYCGECVHQGKVSCAFDGLYFKLCKDTDFCSKGTRRTENA